MNPTGVLNNAPKRVVSKPKIISLIFFIIIVVIWVPHTLPFFKNMASMQIIAAIFLAPLAIVGLFLSYNSGISLAKFDYKRVTKGKLFVPYGILLIIHVLCIGACILHELILTGYPFKMCFDYCQQIEMPTAIMAYFIVSFVLFLPAYCAIYRYRKWILKYDLMNPIEK
ncbi:hypothetical protein IKD49_01675 [Candidatus Saccharibacteria bacterium]|nr:hypothetical protein [Candidatus Saccharibacteria bacterium]MBR3138572.1 hypothetical protein [Candidatus Saccharibacteria bacterium]